MQDEFILDKIKQRGNLMNRAIRSRKSRFFFILLRNAIPYRYRYLRLMIFLSLLRTCPKRLLAIVSPMSLRKGEEGRDKIKSFNQGGLRDIRYNRAAYVRAENFVIA